MTSSQHGPYVLGYTHATMAGTTGGETARWSNSLKAGLSSDCRLQLAYMKPELLVTAGQHTAVNMFPGSRIVAMSFFEPRSCIGRLSS